jgi:beta-mannosidase
MNRQFSVEIPGNTSLICFDTAQNQLLANVNPAEVMLVVTFKNSLAGSEVRNILYFVPPKDLNLPVPLISKTVKASAKGYTIRLSSDKLVKNLFLSSSVPGDFSDNYFDLIPGETVDVELVTRKKDAKISEKIVAKSLVDSY